MNWGHLRKWIGILLGLIIFMMILLVMGTVHVGQPLAGSLAPKAAGWAGLALLIVCTVDTLLLGAFIFAAYSYGWRLIFSTALLVFGVKIFQATIEAAYYMRNLPPAMAPRFFITTLLLALLCPPVAVWLLGKARPPIGADAEPGAWTAMRNRRWLWQIPLLGLIIYPLLFFAFNQVGYLPTPVFLALR